MMMNGDDDLLFSDDDDGSAQEGPPERLKGASQRPWRVLIVDDDREVHAITRLALGNVEYKGRNLQFLSAYSGEEAKKVMAEELDIAVILLDVVMETDDAGLRTVGHVRNVLNNHQTRIVLRTGQPGQAPEREVIINYDINEYKAKAELTSQKLFTTIIAALRSYEHIMTIETNRVGLERILEASSKLFERRSLRTFVEGVMIQLRTLIGGSEGSILCTLNSVDDGAGNVDFRIVSAIGDIEINEDSSLKDIVDESVAADLSVAFAEKRNIYTPEHCVILFRSLFHSTSVVYITGRTELSDIDRNLLDVFCSKVAIGFDNVFLYEQLLNAQKATVIALADLAEHKDEDTGDHVRRIEVMTEAVARKLLEQKAFADELDELFIEQIGLASILHDVGKVAIPDNILQKPARLTPDEWEIMKTHAAAGARILESARKLVPGRNYLSLASEIASCHHEKYDGTGYPKGLQGVEIPLSARITTVADVFDALVSRRPYKDPWPVDEAYAYLREHSGTFFDPVIVDAFIATRQQHEKKDMEDAA